MIDAARRTRKVLGWYAFGSACLAALLIGVLLTYQDRTVTAGVVMSAIGLNLIASVIFAVIFSMLSNRVRERSLEDAIDQGFQGINERLRQEVARADRMFLPTAVYEPINPTDSFGDPYNLDVTHSLESTTFFAFQGPSARFIAARILQARHYPQQIKIAMISPGNPAAIARRAADRLLWPQSDRHDPAALEAALREELVMNVVSLFECRIICPVDLLYYEDTAVYRYVMFDDALYLSWYHSGRSSNMEMPESYRFPAESYLYQSMRMELGRRFDISGAKVRFEAGQTDDVLMGHLSELLARPVGPGDLRKWRDRYKKLNAPFIRYLNNAPFSRR